MAGKTLEQRLDQLRADRRRFAEEQDALIAIPDNQKSASTHRRLVALCRRLSVLENRIADMDYLIEQRNLAA